MGQNLSGYGSALVSSNIYIPFEGDQARVYLTETLRAHANAINKREIAIYDQRVSPTGQSWPPIDAQNTQVRQPVFRKLIDVTIDHASSPQSFAHGLDLQTTVFTHIYGVAQGSNESIPLPQSGVNAVALTVNSSSVVIETLTSAYNGFTGYVVLEYIERTI